MKHYRLRPLQELVDILFPRHCLHCGQMLIGEERYLCTNCWMHLPYTHHAAVANNETEVLFQAHREIESAMSLLYFSNGTGSRDIIHNIKYKKAQRLAITMGIQIGEQLADSNRFDTIDLLIPVPLHPRRERQRGYNQSELLCRGIAKTLKKPIVTDVLIRTVDTESQTHKSAEERRENVKGVFQVRKSEKIANKHILLVDDVITTGSTTLACCEALIKTGLTHISIASLSLASSQSI